MIHSRMRRAAAMALGIALIDCSGRGGDAVAQRSCDVAEPPVLSDSGVGALRVGATVDSVKLACQVLSDTTLAAGNEGMPERRLTVVLGSVAASATIVDDRVWRIEILSPRFRTLDSLGVGSTVADLRVPGARLLLGEGAYIVRDDHCGLSFQLGRGIQPQERTIDDLPDSARVRRVLVVGCG